jgi:hypothetical protein
MAPRRKKDKEEAWPELVVRIKVDTDPKKVYAVDAATNFFIFDRDMRLLKSIEYPSKVVSIEWSEETS